MERIERALEIARLQRSARSEAAALAAPSVAPIPVAAPAAALASTTAPAPSPSPQKIPVATPLTSRTARDAGAAVAAHAPETHAPALPRYAICTDGLRERCVLLCDDPGAAARAYRMLRAQLLQRVRLGRLRVFGIVSAVSGEGKTVTAINLALTLVAEPTQQVALLDFDLRHPSAVLCELEGIPRLQVAPTLAPVSASSECLAGARARALLEQLRHPDNRRLVILDLPPALLSDDVLTVSPLVDGFILVVTEGRTRREDVERVIELVGPERIVGTVLNGSSDSEQRAY